MAYDKELCSLGQEDFLFTFVIVSITDASHSYHNVVNRQLGNTSFKIPTFTSSTIWKFSSENLSEYIIMSSE